MDLRAGFTDPARSYPAEAISAFSGAAAFATALIFLLLVSPPDWPVFIPRRLFLRPDDVNIPTYQFQSIF